MNAMKLPSQQLFFKTLLRQPLLNLLNNLKYCWSNEDDRFYTSSGQWTDSLRIYLTSF